MALSVIGAGFGRTGTMSLKQALDTLGFGPCHHMMEVFRNPGQAELWEGAADGGEWFRAARRSVKWCKIVAAHITHNTRGEERRAFIEVVQNHSGARSTHHYAAPRPIRGARRWKHRVILLPRRKKPPSRVGSSVPEMRVFSVARAAPVNLL